MAKHDFGIMDTVPVPNARYDKYEPEKYNCISIDDDYIEPLMPYFQDIPCYWHTLQRPENNLAYCGITLIPPGSLPMFIHVFQEHGPPPCRRIIDIFKQAKSENKYIIHFGI